MRSIIERAQSLLEKCGVAAVITFSSLDLFYCTGRRINHGALLITKKEIFLWTDSRYALLTNDLPQPLHSFISPNFLPLAEQCEKLLGPIGFDAGMLTYSKYQQLCSSAPKAHFVPSSEYFQQLRRKKSPEEISAIERSCNLCDAGFSVLLEHIHTGITEKNLAKKLKSFWFENGAEALSFEPIIAFGVNSACPHWETSDSPLLANSIIQIDIGVALGGYHSDMSRVIFYGEPDQEMLSCYNIVRETYELAFAAARPGMTPYELDRLARENIIRHGYPNAFSHGLGHGVGLAIHEAPRFSTLCKDEFPLEVGDVFTIEPGIYLPGRGGVRFENLVVIEETKTRCLSKTTCEPIFLQVK